MKINKFKTYTLITLALVISGITLFIPNNAFAAIEGGSDIKNDTKSLLDSSIPKSTNKVDSLTDGNNSLLSIVINTLFFLVIFVAVIMIIVSGIKYITSAGNSAQVAAAKHTLVSSIIGLIIALCTYAIVNFIIGAIRS